MPSSLCTLSNTRVCPVHTCSLRVLSAPCMGNYPIWSVSITTRCKDPADKIPLIITLTRPQANPLFVHTHLFGRWLGKPRKLCPLGCLSARFQFGSAMCGAAQSMTWLIVCRAVQGIGGGGIIQLVVITISDIVPLKECVIDS